MKRGPATLAQPAGRRRGVALIVAMWIVVALAGLVLIMSNAVRIEAGAIANRMSLA